LNIYGKDNLNEIKASAEIITTEDLDYIFTLVKDGKSAKLVAKNHALTGIFWEKVRALKHFQDIHSNSIFSIFRTLTQKHFQDTHTNGKIVVYEL
jgi:hypothetical protein